MNLHDLNAKKVFFFSLLKALIFFAIIKNVSTNNNIILALAAISGAIGSSIPVYIKSRNKRNIESTWMYTIKANNRKQSKEVSDKLRRVGIDITTMNGFNDDIDTKVLKINGVDVSDKNIFI